MKTKNKNRFASRLDSEMYAFVAAILAILNQQRNIRELQKLEHDVMPNWVLLVVCLVHH